MAMPILGDSTKDTDLVQLLAGEPLCVCAFQGQRYSIDMRFMDDTDASATKSSFGSEELFVSSSQFDMAAPIEVAVPSGHCCSTINVFFPIGDVLILAEELIKERRSTRSVRSLTADHMALMYASGGYGG